MEWEDFPALNLLFQFSKDINIFPTNISQQIENNKWH